MSRVGERIKEAREKSGMTQKALAKKLGVAEKFVNEVETGRKIINESLISKVSKVLNTDLNDINMVVTDEELQKELKAEKQVRQTKPAEVNEVWNQAFGSVLKNVPIYDYSLAQVKGYKQLATASNKIDGHTANKVFYLKIENNDMTGYRIQENDLALCYSIKEIENNSICLVEFNGKRVIRQIKKLDNVKALLISNNGSMRTETANIKEIKAIAKLYRIEFDL
ncbi:helix-turn-helix domain-containing protein [Clostridium perfringens]|uniref:HTH cro/C1-type domain-containing protein n=2 Tax=Clostridium perfringens TaxID=1502 RepID=Q8XHC1_CLOPE|nr:XRE family transcriptional regulator [Clostridium perfringens]ALG50159.1 putative transcription regulator, lacI/xre family [Clostridium perfringens]EGS9998599.1 helix-turn-helix domain-containing protein [Clostridium perfringens]EGT3612231.1 helix-turn-helix domain-containing protein [Clostridium perfringens]EHK2389393.1 helix-turn-helix domain-containing protein [Clostridium perfringens]EHR1327704.1 helix-turn-helix domain-containing protein [Clostridium perfringens]